MRPISDAHDGAQSLIAEQAFSIISIPTQKFRSQNPVFHAFYEDLQQLGIAAEDVSLRALFLKRPRLLQIHFPEHFTTNYPFPVYLARGSAFLLVLLYCKARGIKIVWTVHNVFPFEHGDRLATRVQMRSVRSLVDGLIFLSESSRTLFRRSFTDYGTPSEIIIRHPAYDVPLAPLPAASDGAIGLGLLSEQKWYKDPLRALDVFNAAKAAMPAPHLLIGGTVFDEPKFRDKLRSFQNAEYTWINERLSDSALSALIYRSHFVLMPYKLIWNSGFALLALSHGRPIITTDHPLFRELRDFFGTAWVRILDGTEQRPAFWALPEEADFESLKQKLEQISIRNTALATQRFFRSLIADQGMTPIIGPAQAR